MTNVLMFQPNPVQATFAPPEASARVSDDWIELIGLPQHPTDQLEQADDRMVMPQERAELLGFATLQADDTENIGIAEGRTGIFSRLGATMIAGSLNKLSDAKRWYEHTDTHKKRLVKFGSTLVGLAAAVGTLRGYIPRFRLVSNGTVNVPGDVSIVNIYQPGPKKQDRRYREEQLSTGLVAA